MKNLEDHISRREFGVFQLLFTQGGPDLFQDGAAQAQLALNVRVTAFDGQSPLVTPLAYSADELDAYAEYAFQDIRRAALAARISWQSADRSRRPGLT
jgi:hypothetical protein